MVGNTGLCLLKYWFKFMLLSVYETLKPIRALFRIFTTWFLLHIGETAGIFFFFFFFFLIPDLTLLAFVFIRPVICES